MKAWQIGMSIAVALLSVLTIFLGIADLGEGSKFGLFLGIFWLGFAFLTPYTWVLELHQMLKDEEVKREDA